jgi:hypothetical protein
MHFVPSNRTTIAAPLTSSMVITEARGESSAVCARRAPEHKLARHQGLVLAWTSENRAAGQTARFAANL